MISFFLSFFSRREEEAHEPAQVLGNFARTEFAFAVQSVNERDGNLLDDIP